MSLILSNWLLNVKDEEEAEVSCVVVREPKAVMSGCTIKACIEIIKLFALIKVLLVIIEGNFLLFLYKNTSCREAFLMSSNDKCFYGN